MFLTGALIMVYNLVMTVRSPSTNRVVPGYPAGAIVAGE